MHFNTRTSADGRERGAQEPATGEVEEPIDDDASPAEEHEGAE